MASKERLIFSRRFPRIDPDQAVAEMTEDTADDLESCEEFLREIQENSAYVPRPDKLKERGRFINLAKRLSLDYKFDVDIKEHDYFVSVHLHLYHGVYARTLKQKLAGLMDLCDCIGIFSRETEACDFTLCLDYYTHDYYLSGHKLN